MSTESFQEAQRKVLDRYGVSAESRFVELPAVDGPVHVLVAGEGRDALMVPGFGDPAALWAPLIAGLPGLRLHAVDRPCFGLSGRAEYRASTFRKLAVDFLEQAIDALGLDRPLVIANSIGSHWAICLAIERPERVAETVHIGCPAFILGTSAPLPMRILSVGPIGKFAFGHGRPTPEKVEKFGRMVGVDLSAATELKELLAEAQKLPGARSGIPELLRAVVRVRGARPEVRIDADELAGIRQPVQLIWGDRDRFGSVRIAEQTAASIPDARLHIVAGGGHLPWIQETSEVADVTLSFLRDRSAI